MLKTIFSSYFLLSLLFFLPGSAVADSAKGPMILDIFSIKSARVLITSSMAYQRKKWDESDLAKFVCARVTSDRNNIAKLVEILGNLSPAPNVVPINQLRGGIYLTLNDGKQIKLLIGRGEYYSADRAVVVSGYAGVEALSATPLNFLALTAWAKSTENDTDYKEEKKYDCEY